MSLENLEMVEKAVRVTDFVAASGFIRAVREDVQIIQCPSCGQDMWALASGFLCSNRSCFFRAGSVVDFLAWQHNGHFVKALEQLFREFGHQLQCFSTMPTEAVIATIAKTAYARRELFEFFLRLNYTREKTPFIVSCEGWMAKASIDADLMRSSVYPATAAQCQQLLKLLNNLGFSGTVPAEDCILFPFFGRHHSVAEIFMYPRKHQKWHRTSAFAHRFSYAGLLDASPLSPTNLCHNHTEAAQLMTHYQETAQNKACLGLFYNSSGKLDSYIPTDPCYLYDPVELAIQPAAFFAYAKNLRTKLHDLKSSDNSLPSIKWPVFIVDEVVQRIRKAGRLTPGVQLFVDSAALSTADQGHVLRELRNHRMIEAEQELMMYFRTVPVYKQGDYSLFATAGGYLVSKKHDIASSVTTFTVDLHSNLMFTNSSDLFHAGEMIFNGRRYPILLDNSALDNVRQFEALMRNAEARASVRDVERKMPAVKDRAGIKHVMAHLRNVVSNLDTAQGLASLGWNGRHDVFYSPYWCARDGAVQDTKFVFHPDSDILKIFYPTPPVLGDLTGKLSTGFCALIAQAVAMVTRSYMQMAIQPIQIKNTANAREILTAVFRGLGQRELCKLNFNSRGGQEIRDLEGFPFAAYGYSPGQLQRSTLPAFVLSEDGAEFAGAPNNEELQLAAAVLNKAVQATAVWMLQTQGKEFKREQSISLDVEMTREGQTLLRTVCGFSNWPEAPMRYQLFEKVLRLIPADQVRHYFQHFLAGQKVYFDYTKFAGAVDLDSLALELAGMAEYFDRTSQYFVLDALSATNALNCFYDARAFPEPIVAPPLEPGSPSQ